MIFYLQNDNKLRYCILLLISQLILIAVLPKKIQAAENSYKVNKALVDAIVTGKVTDENGEALVGVSIRVKGTRIGTSTTGSGDFSITIPASVSNAVLEVSYLGFLSQEVAVSGRTRINIQLKSAVAGLNEVVVVGYNQVKKTDLTGATVSVSAEDIRSRPVANALQAIQGKAAGVDVTSNERPGEVGKILIRGARSLTATNVPLYVVDGVPLAAGGIEAINPNDIEAIDILKDASATAVYGSRGANGVVIITTKRGKTGSLSLNYAGTSTIEKLHDRTEMMNSAQYIQFRRDANKVTTPTQASDKLLFGQDPYAYANVLKGWVGDTFDGSLVPTTDWGDMVLRTGVSQDHNLSVSGGTEKIKAYGSFGYLSQLGTQLGQDYKRYSSNFSVDIKPVKWFSMGGSVNVAYGLQNYGYATPSGNTGPASLYLAAQAMLPFTVPFADNGNRINLPGGDINILNPLGEDKYNINLRKVLRTMGSLYAEVTIMDGLKYRVNFGPDFYNYNNGRWMDEHSILRGGGEPGSTNSAQLTQNSKLSYTLDHLLYYNKTLGKHDFGLTLLQSSSSNREETSDMKATKLPYNSQLWYQLNSVSALDGFSSGLITSTLVSYMGRFNYSYNNKYLLTVSGRWDGASVLADGHKWDFFPSAALAWRIDQEDFMKGISWVDQFKVRLGVGSTGNAAVEPYSTLGILQTLYYTFGSSVQPGYVASDASLAKPIPLPNHGLGWEHTTQYNLGLDFSILKGRVSGALDLYTSRTKDLLLMKSIPSINGYTQSLVNIGATANKGIELTLNTVNIKKNDFTWSTTLSLSANRDRIVQLANGKIDDIGNKWFINQRLKVYYDYVKIGIWQNTPEDLAEIAKFKANGNTFKPGDIRIKDLNGDYKIDANNDRQIVGHANPDWVGGMSNTFRYKNFDLTCFIFSRLGYQIEAGAESLQGRFAQRVVDYWTPNNPTNDYPAPNTGSAAGDPYKSSMNYQSGSFIKIRDISLGYYLPDALCKKLTLSKVKVYAQALNPGLIYSKVDWIDPDTGNSTFNRGFVLGLNVGF
ncbi:MAG: TonB-dependent receptor [Candidatus Pedobacter colombiensis]|uniref:TonB-dependent receptor n=1 Tax=Candidatus Pedobacter colombiensis TaxID=3121371 RepID=A0AAJ5WAQ4_9SPHI|nr:TonB-dependent receptor [Pedobacter sp.]WEK20186.1 MAG: TonB-dependent receptor [Pedobacter sp.]